MAATSGAQSIFQQWKNFDLTTLQRELDETASELANRQDESENSRKILVDQSRDFKKNTPEEVRKQVTPLLKSFQAEIDSLSKRSKAAEASFLSLYKKITEAPDPVPAMDQLMQTQKKSQRCSELELENKNLRLTLDQYNAEFAEVRNQEITIRQLKERIKFLEDQADSIVEARVVDQETASKRFYDERERELREENESLSQKLNEAEERASALQTSLNAAQSELFVLRSRGDEVGSAKASEMELILLDVERANQRADSAEKECELLKEKINSLEQAAAGTDSSATTESAGENHEDGSDGNKYTSASREVELTAKEKQIGQLLEELKQVNGKLIDGETRHQSERIELTQQLQIAQRRLDAAEATLKTQADYDEIKRELNVLKSIELGQQENEDDDSSYDAVNMAADGNKQKSLEVLLLEKNKAVQDENATLRNDNRKLNVQQAPTTSASQSFYRDISDEQLSALIASVSQQQSDPNMDSDVLSSSGGLDQNSISDHRRKKDSNKGPGGAPLQNVVKRMACLIGSELVAMYQATEEQASGSSSNALGENACKDSNDSVDQSIADVLPVVTSDHNSSDSAMTAMAMDLFASMRTPTPAGFEEALAGGVPREIVEYVALYHLQQMVAKQVREYATSGEILDTAEVAQRCRVALSTHNIGQRLLAKCILNQSQGSVSELLSKPKPWEKLTEKGKESFRRIKAWLSDESSVELLRMISPKRAYGGFRERYPTKQDESLTQEKLNAILAKAQSKSDVASSNFAETTNSVAAMNAASSRSSMNYSPESRHTATPNSTGASCSKSAVVNRASGRYRHDDIPKEMIYEIYRREVEKLQTQGTVGNTTDDVKAAAKSIGTKSLANVQNAPRRFQTGLTSSQSSLSQSAGGARSRRLDPKRLAGLGLSFTQRRTPQQTAASIIRNNQLLSIRHRSLFANNRRAENRAGMRLPPVRASWSTSRAKFLSSIRTDEPLTMTPTTTVGSGSKSMVSSSPEELPQSFSPGGTPIIGTKAFKAILPPITQEQFEEYNNIDTEDLVRRVKDYLTKYSISQRLFGEQVLGLSQGSVSDLLARPKLWSMLTQKGREPFIRMQLFLNDKKALQKLLEKRQQQLQAQQNGGESGDGMECLIHDEGSSEFAMPSQASSVPTQVNTPSAFSSGSRSRRKPALPRVSMAVREGSRPRELSGIAALLQVAMRGGASGETKSRSVSGAATSRSLGTRRYVPASAIPEPTEPIDTKNIVTQVKALLLAHNIGQKVFGATVLDMSQGAVSDLLSKTKPWELLSARGREAMLRMKAWLEDSNRLEKVLQGRSPAQPREAKKALEDENSAIHETVAQQKSLIAELEDDLLRVNTLQRPEAIGAECPDDFTQDFLTKAVSSTPTSADRNASAADSMLLIVTGQRERFRQRVQELEEQNLQYQQHMALLQTEFERSRADNVKLYEKIKFLQSYRGSSQATLSMADDQTVEKYSSEYEQSLDPFRRFGVQERQRTYQALRTHDKATLRISRMIMSSGAARAFFFFYLLFLHCLVFLVLYKAAYTESCKRDFNTECVQKFQEHMHQVHGEAGRHE